MTDTHLYNTINMLYRKADYIERKFAERGFVRKIYPNVLWPILNDLEREAKRRNIIVQSIQSEPNSVDTLETYVKKSTAARDREEREIERFVNGVTRKIDLDL